MGAGRPTKFNDALKEKILALCKAGKTNKQISDIIGVSIKTIHNWMGKHPTFLHALKESKQIADELVVASLFSRAVGYSHKEEKVFQHEGSIITHDTVRHYPPDTTAAIFWLKNRQPKQWRRDQEAVTINNISEQSDEALDARLKKLLADVEPSEQE